MFGLFRKKDPDEKVYRPGGCLTATLVKISGGYLSYRGHKGDLSMVPIDQIKAVSLSSCGLGSSQVVVTGAGSELARFSKLPTNLAAKTMIWIKDNLNLA